jgi:UDP-N-acetylglucosamine 4,6-dehydratase
MRIIDLAGAMAPGLPHDIIGVRPGEKIHEVMITEDDARMTLELPDRYVICPPNAAWKRDHLDALGAKSVPEGFRYSSDLNTEWLEGGALTDMIARKAA